MDSSRQMNAFGGAFGQGQTNYSGQENNAENPMFNNQNDAESSRMEDVGGADGLEGVNNRERRTANFQER